MTTPSPNTAGKAGAMSPRLLLAIAWGVVVALLGGLATGLMLNWLGMMGTITLWALGALAGFVGRRIMAGPCRGVAAGLIVAVVFAWLFGEVYWIRGNIVNANNSWTEAIKLLPQFATSGGTMAMFVGALFTGFGGYSIWWQLTALGGVRRTSLRDERIIRGLCPGCGYDLHASRAATACPECGEAVPRELRA